MGSNVTERPNPRESTVHIWFMNDLLHIIFTQIIFPNFSFVEAENKRFYIL